MSDTIDDEQVENYIEDPISLKGFDELTVIDIDSIEAAIEDPGCILEEVPHVLNRNDEYKSSYKKRSFMLPVTFFDISRNISLLKKCRPISIKIVDCDIYPWYYYKQTKHVVTNNKDLISNKNKNSNQLIPSHCTTDLNLTWCNTNLGKSLCLTSSRQRSPVLKIRENIESRLYLNEVNNNIETEKVSLKCVKDLSALNKDSSDCCFDENLKVNDLLKYRGIAQTIVRNATSKQDNVTISTESSKISRTPENVQSNVGENVDRNRFEKKEKREKFITSPILPYTTKSQKNIKSNESVLKKSTNPNNTLEKCNKHNKYMSSFNQVIPHYHRTMPISTNNNNSFNCQGISTNGMYPQELITKDSPLYWQSSGNNNIIRSDNIQSIPPFNSKGMLQTCPNSVANVSYYLNNKACNDSLITTSRMQLTENINPDNYTPITNNHINCRNSLFCQNNIHEKFVHQRELNINNVNNMDLKRQAITTKKSTENWQVLPQSPGQSKNIDDDCVCSSNTYLNYRPTQISLARTVNDTTNTIQKNPLLTHLLNGNNRSEYYQGVLKHQTVQGKRQSNRMGVGSILGRTPQPFAGQNLWLLARLPTSRHEYYLPSTQFSPHKSFHYSNTYFHNLSNPEDTTLLQHITNSNLRPSELNPTELRKSIPDVSTYESEITGEVRSRNDSIKDICVHIKKRNTSQVLSESSGVNQKILNDTSVKFNYTEPSVSRTLLSNVIDKKKSNKHELDATNNILGVNNCDCINLKEQKRKISNNKKSLLKKSVLNSLKQPQVISKIDGDLNIKNNTLQPTTDIKVGISEPAKVNGYSPAILPIPTFRKSLEMVSELQRSRYSNTTKNTNLKTEIHNDNDLLVQTRINNEFTNVSRKRKLGRDENVYMNSKRISLEEYKLRRFENENFMMNS